MPAFVLHEGIVSPKVHRHRLSTVWDEFCRDPHIFLLLYHLADDLFIIISFLTAWLAALKKSIVPLRIKQSFFIKSCFLETVIHIRCQHKIVLVPHRHRSQPRQPPQALFEAARTGNPVFCIVDDTIASKTKPLSRALHPIEDAYFHQSHLKKKQDYGHQAVAVMLSCNGIVLNYAFVMYNKSISKIDIVQNIMCTDMRETSTA